MGSKDLTGLELTELLHCLQLPEKRVRDRARSELRRRDRGKVYSALAEWMSGLERDSPEYLRSQMEGVWLAEWAAHGQVESSWLLPLLSADDHRARAAAVQVVARQKRWLPESGKWLQAAAEDEHGRVRAEAMVAASWIGGELGASMLAGIQAKPIDRWLERPLKHAQKVFDGSSLESLPEEESIEIPSALTSESERKSYRLGHEVYHREAHCATCHQSDGQGVAGVYPPLVGTRWVLESEERLIQLILHGITGEIQVKGKTYGEGIPPMTAFGKLLEDEELAAVVNYVRNSWGNQAGWVSPDKVAEVRSMSREQNGYWQASDLLSMYPMVKKVEAGQRLEDPKPFVDRSSGLPFWGAAAVGAWVFISFVGLLKRD